MAILRMRAERAPAESRARWGGMALVLLLALVAGRGILLCVPRAASVLIWPATVLHLGAVLAFFVTVPFTKMVRAPYRLAALVRDVEEREAAEQAVRRVSADDAERSA